MLILYLYTPLVLLLIHAWLLIVTHDYALVLKHTLFHVFEVPMCEHSRLKFTNGEIQIFLSVVADRTVCEC